MQLSNKPSKLLLPFAATGGKRVIPVDSQIGITAGAASLVDGFPPLTRIPETAGGVGPSGLDMNGILNEMSAVDRWSNAGGGYPFDATFANDVNVGGYPKGARVLRTDGLGYWLNTVDNNVTDPEDAGTAVGWYPDFTVGVSAITMTNANVTLTPLQYGKPIIVITGVQSANLNLIMPTLVDDWIIVNRTTGTGTITAKTAAGTGIPLLRNYSTLAFCDGTNIVPVRPNNSAVQVQYYVTGGSGTEADPWTGWDTAIAWAARTTYQFDDGWYAYVTSPNFAFDDLQLLLNRGTVIKCTGTGYVMVCDAGAVTGNVIRVDISGGRLEGNAGSAGGFLQRACSRSVFSLSFRNIPGTCFEDVYGVLNRYTLDHTAFVYGETVSPARLLTVTRRGVSEQSSDNEYYVIAENCTAPGLNLSFCLNSRFYGGTSESNVGGIYIETSSSYNTFFGLDLEVNGVGLDIECRGDHNMFLQCLSTGTAQIQGRNNKILGGTYNTLRAWGTGNSFDGCMYSNGGGTFDTSGGTAWTKRLVWNANTALFDNDETPNTIKGLTIGTSGLSIDAAATVGAPGGYTSGNVLLKIRDKNGSGGFHTFETVNGSAGNAAVCGLRLTASSVTGRALNAGGTVNASGADYAEYFRKVYGCPYIQKGDIVGIDANGEITDQFADAINFLIKSTDPSLVGGDTWAQNLGERPEITVGARPADLCNPPPVLDPENPTEKEQVATARYVQQLIDCAQAQENYDAALALEVAAQVEYDTAHEIERTKYDRLAIAGQVPVNVTGAVPGDYIIPTNAGGFITGTAVANPTFAQYKTAIGKVIRIDDTGRAVVIVKPL
jgi:hypothetical protein